MALSGGFRKAFSLVIDFEIYKAYRNLHLLGDKGRQGNCIYYLCVTQILKWFLNKLFFIFKKTSPPPK